MKIWCDAQFYNPEEDNIEEIVNHITVTATDYSDNKIVMLHCIGAIQSLVMRHGADIISDTCKQMLIKSCSNQNDTVKQAAETCYLIVQHSTKQIKEQSPSPPDLTLSFLDEYIVSGLRSGQFQPRQWPMSTGHVTRTRTKTEDQLITSPYNVLSQSHDTTLSRSSNTDNSSPLPPKTLWTSEGRLESPVNVEIHEEVLETKDDEFVSSNTAADEVIQRPKESIITGEWD